MLRWRRPPCQPCFLKGPLRSKRRLRGAGKGVADDGFGAEEARVADVPPGAVPPLPPLSLYACGERIAAAATPLFGILRGAKYAAGDSGGSGLSPFQGHSLGT